MANHPLAGKPVLVTGATGFLGTHLVLELLRLGAEVHGLREDASRQTRIPTKGVIWHTGDLMIPDSLRQAVRDSEPEVVFHLAAYGVVYGQKDEDRIFRVNVQGTWDLWRVLDQRSCRFVHVGSCGEYGEARGQVKEDHACRPQWFYPATKNAATVLIATLGRRAEREVVILRPFGPFGPADQPGRVVPQTIEALIRGEEVAVTAGEQLRDYAYVDDHVAAFVLAGSRPLAGPGRIYNIGSGRPIPLRRLLETIADAVGDGARERVRFGKLPYRPDETWEMCCDISAARADLGYEPRVSLEEGIGRTVRWYREHIKK